MYDSGPDLSSADLSSADLSSGDLSGPDLSGTEQARARLTILWLHGTSTAALDWLLEHTPQS